MYNYSVDGLTFELMNHFLEKKPKINVFIDLSPFTTD